MNGHGCCIILARQTNYHKLGSLDNRILFLTSEIKVSAGLIPSEAFLLALHVAAFLLGPHMDFPPCALGKESLLPLSLLTKIPVVPD